MSKFENFSISPKFRVSHWVEQREAVNWGGMIEIFQDRIEGRFLKAIELIRTDESEIGKFSGFSIMAIDCLIIETLKQFYDGLDTTPERQSRAKFREFFSHSNTLQAFGEERLSKIFYKHFRCGLLHQAQTLKKSKIKRGLGMLFIVETNLNEGITIDRDIFHNCLLSEIDHYKTQLSIDTNIQLRENFIRKMNYICNQN